MGLSNLSETHWAEALNGPAPLDAVAPSPVEPQQGTIWGSAPLSLCTNLAGGSGLKRHAYVTFHFGSNTGLAGSSTWQVQNKTKV